jgi:rod shape-determining protein MreD
MRRLARPAAAVVLLVLQTTAGGPQGIHGAHPDFLLLFVLLVGMRGGETAGTLWGVLLGFLQDTFSVGLSGLHLLTKGLLGFAAGTLREQLDCENPNTQAMVALVATLAEGGAILVLLQVFSAERALLAPFLGTVLPAAALHGILLPAGAALGSAVARRARGLRRPAAERV